MTYPTYLEAYSDVRMVLDAVINRGVAQYELPSRAEAFEFRRRAYRFRKIADRKGEKQYNHLIMRIPDASSKLVFGQREVTGILLDEAGNPVPLFSSPDLPL